MYYKLYKETAKASVSNPRGLQLFPEFKKLYDENDVKVIGVWENVDNPREYYFLTAYRDEQHYQEFGENLRSNQQYLDLSKEIEEDRESIEAITLKMVVDL